MTADPGGKLDRDRVRQTGDADNAVSMMWHEHQLHVLTEALRELEKLGVVAVPLKGPCLAQRIYAMPWARLSSDLDFLVPSEQCDEAVQALQELGWQPEHGRRLRRQRRWFSQHQVLRRTASPPIEIHHRISDRPGSGRVSSSMLESARKLAVTGMGTVTLLAPEDEFLYLCLHAATHRFSQTKWIEDLVLHRSTYAETDWSRIEERARRFGLETALWALQEMTSAGFSGCPTEIRPNAVVRRYWPAIIPAAGEDEAHLRMGAGISDSFYRAALCDSAPKAIAFFAQRMALLGFKRLGA